MGLRYRVGAKEALQGQLGWSLSADQRTLQRGETPVTIGKGESADIVVKLHVPEVRESVVLPAVLSVRLCTTLGKLLAVERPTAVVVDLNEQIAGKSALQEAAAQIAKRLLPKLALGGPTP